MQYGKCSLLQTLDQLVMLKWKEGYSFQDEISFAMILLWIRYLFRAKSLELWLVTSSVSEEAEKGGAWEGTGLVQCFSIRNSFIIKIYEGRRGLRFHHACCQARASANFSLQRPSLAGQQNDHSLQLSATIPKHFVSSQHREKIPSSFPILSTVQRVTTVGTAVGLSSSLCRPTPEEVARCWHRLGNWPKVTQDQVSEVVHHPVQLQSPTLPIKA